MLPPTPAIIPQPVAISIQPQKRPKQILQIINPNTHQAIDLNSIQTAKKDELNNAEAIRSAFHESVLKIVREKTITPKENNLTEDNNSNEDQSSTENENKSTDIPTQSANITGKNFIGNSLSLCLGIFQDFSNFILWEIREFSNIKRD